MTDIAHSKFGYWIEPSGTIHALEKSMAHSEWLSVDGRYAAVDDEDAMERAILDGWIGVSISPVGESVGIRVRPGSAEKKAARALGRIFKADDLWDREVYTDFSAWSGRALYNHLVRTGFNRDIFGDVQADIRYTEKEITELQEQVSYVEALRAARAEGNGPDHRRLQELASEIANIADDAYSNIERISPVGDGIADIEDLRRYCIGQIEVFDQFRVALEAPISEMPFALAGSAMPELTEEQDRLVLIDRDLPELELLEQLKNIEFALRSRVSSARAPPEPRETSAEFDAVLCIVDKIKTGCGILVSSKLKLLEKAVADTDLSRDNLEFAARYYIGHELARTFSVCGRMYAKDLREALDKLPMTQSPRP
ncbi:hypothetical protein G6L37_05450 [Agrobacterium rubi]|nr:hypothetical protein [Agrobacterium rubi]NTF24803.1 hypothetical protein [Agrobacterium rubi]